VLTTFSEIMELMECKMYMHDQWMLLLKVLISLFIRKPDGKVTENDLPMKVTHTAKLN
jgi:hypothetical protein